MKRYVRKPSRPAASRNSAVVDFSRRQFLVRGAAGLAGATMASAGFAWGDLAYGQQLSGQPASFNVAIRPDWTQGWFGMINQEKGFWKKYLPPGSEVTFSHPIQGGIVTNELIAEKSMIGHNGDAPGLIATFQRDRADIRVIGLTGSSPSGYSSYQVLVRKDAPEFKSSKEAVKWLDGKKVATPKGSSSDRFFQFILEKEGCKTPGISEPLDRRDYDKSAQRLDRWRLHLGSAGLGCQHDRGGRVGAGGSDGRAMGTERLRYHRLPQGFHG